MSDELKPCPFCGGAAKAGKSRVFTETFVVRCKAGHTDGLAYRDKADAIAAWNRRATVSA